ncbi:MAG: DUF4912 domain-containing protein [Isosphaeraceae bacterium]
MTVETLKGSNKKALAQMAKELGVVGWHSMRKDQLIRALTPYAAGNKRPVPKSARPAPAPATRTAAHAPSKSVNGNGMPVSRVVPPLPMPRSLDHGCTRDRIVTMVRDPFWLHVHWELSRSTLARAQAALGQEWHQAHPILRLMDITSEDTTSASERHVRDIDIHGGVANWYIDVPNPPRSYRVDIGYLSKKGKFYVLARSNVVSTPKAGVSEVVDQSWQGVQDAQRVISQSHGPTGGDSPDVIDVLERQIGRSLGQLPRQGLGMGAFPGLGAGNFHFQIDAELIVYGSTEPNAQVTLQGEHVPVRPDGTFTVRFSLPDSRQIIPAVASSPNGVEERTIVLAIERNTKELEPMIHDGNEL